MSLCIEGRLVFIHAPKTGGSFVTSLLEATAEVRSLGHQHDSANCLPDSVRQKYRFFTFVRRPEPVTTEEARS